MATSLPKFTAHKPYTKKHTHYICKIKVYDPIYTDAFQCNAVFENFQSLATHNKLIHKWPSDPPHCCQFCEVYLKSRCEFLAHDIYHLKLLYAFVEGFPCCSACDKMYQDIFNHFDAKNCFQTSPVTMDEQTFKKLFKYVDKSKIV